MRAVHWARPFPEIMKSFISLLLFASAVLRAEDIPARMVDISVWTIEVPTDTTIEEKADMPDFAVTYFSFPSLGATMGIYEGGHPSRFSEEATGVNQIKDTLGGEDTTWSVWTTGADDDWRVMAEAIITSQFIRLSEHSLEFEQKFHIFISAPDEPTRVEVQRIARTLKKKEAN
jgi:hypothetical protein